MSKKSILIHRAERFCETHKYRMTEPRARVLSALAKDKQPMGAYQIINLLSSQTEKVSPPTIYRAIEFWHKHGFIHRIESMNAYVACCEHQHHENFCIFICSNCNTTQELNMKCLPGPVTHDIKNRHLTITNSVTEIRGKCSQCS